MKALAPASEAPMTAFALAISSSAWRKPNSGCSAAQPEAMFRISVEGLIG